MHVKWVPVTARTEAGQLTWGGGTLYVRASSEEILASMLAADKVL